MCDVAATKVELTFLDDEDTGSQAGARALLAADLVLISNTVTPSNLAPDLVRLPVPILNVPAALSVDLGLATVAGLTPSGETFIDMNPDTADHPLAGGLVGRAEVFSAPVAMLDYGEVGGDAIVIATAPGSPSIPVIYADEAGTTLADGRVAPAQRVAAWITLEGLAVASGGAATLYFASLDWMLGTA